MPVGRLNFGLKYPYSTGSADPVSSTDEFLSVTGIRPQASFKQRLPEVTPCFYAQLVVLTLFYNGKL